MTAAPQSEPAGFPARHALAVVLLLAVACIAVSVCRYTPTTTYELPGAHRPGLAAGQLWATSRVESLQVQRFDPWHYLGGENREPIRWRLLLPALSCWTHLPMGVYFLLPRLGGCLIVFVAGWVVWRGTGSLWGVAAASLLTATSAPFQVAMDWFEFDPFALLALLAFAFAPSELAAWVAAALGPWIDERFLLILPAVAGLRWATGRRAMVPALWGVVPYCAVRVAGLILGDNSVSDQLSAQHQFNHWWAVGWWFGFRAAWVVIALGLWVIGRALWRRTGVSVFVVWALALLVGLAASVWFAYDTSRSIAILLPFLLYGVMAAAKLRRGVVLLSVVMALNLALPAAHVIADAYFPIGPIWRAPVNRGFYFDPQHPGPWLGGG